jgi:hypothetical protein
LSGLPYHEELKMKWADMKKMDIGEFLEKGYLQEANRLFFHPLGLALTVEDNGPGGT